MDESDFNEAYELDQQVGMTLELDAVSEPVDYETEEKDWEEG